jgi:hypothetical protein
MRPDPPVIEQQWFSVCSRHAVYEPTCNNCNVGTWIASNSREYENWLWNHFPKVWKKWANKDDSSGWIRILIDKIKKSIQV